MGLFTVFPILSAAAHHCVSRNFVCLFVSRTVANKEKRMQGISEFVKMVAWKSKNFPSVPTLYSSQVWATCRALLLLVQHLKHLASILGAKHIYQQSVSDPKDAIRNHLLKANGLQLWIKDCVEVEPRENFEFQLQVFLAALRPSSGSCSFRSCAICLCAWDLSLQRCGGQYC